jgi:hypothetical protein
MTTGQTHHGALSSILVLVFSSISPDYKEWPTMPSTNAGFQSHILNPTNQHSLVSILPVPYAFILPYASHAYCCLCEIAAYVLLLTRTTGARPILLRLMQLFQSRIMQDFHLTAPPIRSTQCLVSLGLIFWLDGWDPSASSQNNRSPVHTASVTLLALFWVCHNYRPQFCSCSMCILSYPGTSATTYVNAYLTTGGNLGYLTGDQVRARHRRRSPCLQPGGNRHPFHSLRLRHGNVSCQRPCLHNHAHRSLEQQCLSSLHSSPSPGVQRRRLLQNAPHGRVLCCIWDHTQGSPRQRQHQQLLWTGSKHWPSHPELCDASRLLPPSLTPSIPLPLPVASNSWLHGPLWSICAKL